MVKETNEISTKYGKTIKLKQYLNCQDFGIYSAQCVNCKAIYVGQTSTTFAKRWNTHRKTWKDMITCGKYNYAKKQDNFDDNNALFDHYQNFHKNLITKNLQLWNAYHITFVERPRRLELDVSENFWIEKTAAEINKAKTLLPKFK